MWQINGLYTNKDGKYVKLLGVATNQITDEEIVYFTSNIQINVPVYFLPKDYFRENYILFSRNLHERPVSAIGSGFE